MAARGMAPSQWRALSRADRIEILAYEWRTDRQRAEWQKAMGRDDDA